MTPTRSIIPPEHVKSVIAVGVLGLVAMLIVMSGSAKAAKQAEPEAPIDPASLTPVPMSTEITGAPAKEPLAFVSATFGTEGPRTRLSYSEEESIVKRARAEIEHVQVYDNSWMETNKYPGGDVPEWRGACTDVVVRSYRQVGIDLQGLVHEDIVRDMNAYKLSFTDVHIDHRRVGTMFTFFQRNAMSLTTDYHDKKAFRPGDAVFVSYTWIKGALPEHVGIVSDKVGPRGYLLVIENGGPKPVEQDSLGKRNIVGHFRALRKQDAAAAASAKP